MVALKPDHRLLSNQTTDDSQTRSQMTLKPDHGWLSNQIMDGCDKVACLGGGGTLPRMPAVVPGHLQRKDSSYGTSSTFQILQLYPSHFA